MKKIVAVAILSMLIYIKDASAQLIGGEAFMQGNYIEIGLNSCGGFGTTTLPPAVGPMGTPYHLNTGSVTTTLSGLGFISDSGADGWGDYCGDYFVPGSPVEGWTVGFDGNDYINTDQSCFTNDIPGAITDYQFTCGINMTTWEGSVNGMTVTQDVYFGPDDLFFTIQVTLCNTTGTDMLDVNWGRNVDPDNDAQQYGAYQTDNAVISQAYLGDPMSSVTATGTGIGGGCFLAMQSTEPNSAVSFGGFSTMGASNYWPPNPAFASSGFSSSGTNSADEAIHLGMHWDVLPAGGCVTGSMQYLLSGTVDPVPNFTIEPFCPPTSNPPIPGPSFVPGGTYSFAVPPAAGDPCTINPSTGVLTNAIGGNTYSISYVTPPPCPAITYTTSVTVNSGGMCCGSEAGLIIPPLPITSTSVCVDSPDVVPFIGPFTIMGNNTTAPFTSIFVLVKEDGTCLEFNTTGIFYNLPVGSYCVHSINYDSTDPDLPLGGFNLTNFPTLTSLQNIVNSVDGAGAPGALCSELIVSLCQPITITDQKSPGIGDAGSYCNNTTALVMLHNLLDDEDAGGSWSDVSVNPVPTTLFDAILGTLNILGLSGGTYNFQYTIPASGNCPAVSSVVTVVISEGPTLAGAGLDVSYCDYDGISLDGNIPTIGTGVWTLLSGPPGGMIVDDILDPKSSLTVTQTGIYTLIWSISNGSDCPTSIDTVKLNIATIPDVTFTVDSLICVNDTLQLQYLGDGQVINNFQWNFSHAQYQAGSGDGPWDLSWASVGPKAIYMEVTAGDGCTNDTTAIVEVVGTLVNTIGNQAIHYGESIILNSAISPPDMPISVTWSPSLTLDCDSCLSPDASPLTTTTYMISIQDTNGCVSTDQVIIDIIVDRDIFVPNAFSPNGDGNNDTWMLLSRNIRDISTAVYNRWGEKVWESTDPQIGWDGYYKGKPLDPGVYMYYIEAKYVDDLEINLKGNVTILK